MSPTRALAAVDAAPAASHSTLTLCWQRSSHEPVPGNGVAGVYVIWRTGPAGRVCLVVGENRDIASDLACTLRESHIARYAATGAIEVSWAAAASMHRPGIASYLTTVLSPALAGRTGTARQIGVNLPG